MLEKNSLDLMVMKSQGKYVEEVPLESEWMERKSTTSVKYSKDGEIIEFSTVLKCEGAVESWLNDAEFKIRSILEEIT